MGFLPVDSLVHAADSPSGRSYADGDVTANSTGHYRRHRFDSIEIDGA